MSKVSKPEEIWVLPLDADDVQAGIDYGVISWSSTYDRMGAQAKGNFAKAMYRISVGRAAQHALDKRLTTLDCKLRADETDYVTADEWDIYAADGKAVDLKTLIYYKDFTYGLVHARIQLTPELIVQSTGAEACMTFIPMLYPVDQFSSQSAKEYLVFGIVASNQPKSCPWAGRNAVWVVALPSSDEPEQLAPFLDLKRTQDRVQRGSTFELDLRASRYLTNLPLEVTVGYADTTGAAQRATIQLNQGASMTLKELAGLHFLRIHAGCTPRSSKDPAVPMLQATFRTAGAADVVGVVTDVDCLDLWHADSLLYMIGWTSKQAFAQSSGRHPDVTAGTGAHQGNNIVGAHPSTPGLIARGAFCYLFPPLTRPENAGTKNRNYYCLATDLETMDSLSDILPKSE